MIKAKIFTIRLILCVYNLRAQDWQYLFNGENLDGWEKKGGLAKYKLEEVVMIGTAQLGTPNTFLCTKKRYTDCIFIADVLLPNDLNSAIHKLDIGRWALQVDYPEQVSVDAAKLHFADNGWEMYDTMYATFKFPDNKEIYWDGKSRNCYKTYGAGRGTIIYSTEGSVFVNRESYNLYNRNVELVKKSGKTDASGTTLGGGDTSTKHISYFFEAIRGKEKLSAPIQDGVISNHMALLANISYRTGKPFNENVQNSEAYDREAMALWGREYEPGWEMAA